MRNKVNENFGHNETDQEGGNGKYEDQEFVPVLTGPEAEQVITTEGSSTSIDDKRKAALKKLRKTARDFTITVELQGQKPSRDANTDAIESLQKLMKETNPKREELQSLATRFRTLSELADDNIQKAALLNNLGCIYMRTIVLTDFKDKRDVDAALTEADKAFKRATHFADTANVNTDATKNDELLQQVREEYSNWQAL